jgi:hypothetical protein
MLRKLLLLAATAVAALALTASSAAADPHAVHVENDGHHELETEVDLGVFAHIGGGVEVPMLQCGNDWEIDVAEDGHVLVHVEDIFAHPGSTGACNTADACNSEEWEGQIVENEVGGYAAHLTFCLEGTGTGLSGIPFPIECPMTDVEVHCDATIVPSTENPPTPTMPAIEVMGEGTLHESLGLMHADRP